MQGFTELQMFAVVFIIAFAADLAMALSKGQEFNSGAAVSQCLGRCVLTGLTAMATWSAFNEWLSINNQGAILVGVVTALIGVEAVGRILAKVIKEKLGIKDGEK